MARPAVVIPQQAVNPAQGRQQVQLSLAGVAAAGKRCVDKVEEVEEIVYEDVEECHHSYDKKCHTTYQTEYESQQEEECEDNFQKTCEVKFPSLPARLSDSKYFLSDHVLSPSQQRDGPCLHDAPSKGKL